MPRISASVSNDGQESVESAGWTTGPDRPKAVVLSLCHKAVVESANPESISFLCSHTEMATAAGRMNLIHQTHRGGDDIVAGDFADETP